jgi:hypothetical protein
MLEKESFPACQSDFWPKATQKGAVFAFHTQGLAETSMPNGGSSHILAVVSFIVVVGSLAGVVVAEDVRRARDLQKEIREVHDDALHLVRYISIAPFRAVEGQSKTCHQPKLRSCVIVPRHAVCCAGSAVVYPL